MEVFLELHSGLYPLTAISTVLSCIHFMARNFEFLTRFKRVLWRIAAPVSVGVASIAIPLVPVIAALHKKLVGLNAYNVMGIFWLR